MSFFRYLFRLFFPPRLRVWFTIAGDSFNIRTREGFTMRLTTEQRVFAMVEPKTATGRPAKIDGAVTFASSDEAVARVEPQTETSAYIVAVGPGVAQITASFDADLDEDESRTIEASGAIEVVDAEAETAEIRFGDAEAQV